MQTDRQRWLSVLAHSSAALLETHWQALNLQPAFTLIRPAEIGLTRLQARMGATGKRFVMGDATVTRAVVQLSDGTLGYSYLLGQPRQPDLCRTNQSESGLEVKRLPVLLKQGGAAVCQHRQPALAIRLLFH